MRWWKSGDLKKTEFVSRLSEMNPAKWGILLLIGVLLAVAAMPVSSKQQKKIRQESRVKICKKCSGRET